MKTKIEADGKTIIDTGAARWECSTPDQAEKHLPTWTDQQRDGKPSEVIAQGDVSAIRDLANDYHAQRARRKKYRPSESYVYENGEAIRRDETTGEIVQPKDNPQVASLARRILDYFA